MAINNYHEITGTLYAKKVRKVIGKQAKNLGKEYEFYYYIVEVPTRKTWTADGAEKSVEKKELVKFKLPMGMSPDDFEVGDNVFIGFNITGREFERNDGSGKDVINENDLKTIKHTDVQTKSPLRETTFIPPSQQADAENDDDQDLPF